MRVFGQCLLRRLVTCLMTVLTSVPLGCAPAAGSPHRRAARHVIDVHRRKAALVMMRVPERKLLTTMRRTERIVDIENLLPARLTVVPDWSSRAAVSRAAWVLLGAFSRRLMVDCEASAAPLLRTAADRELHQRIVPQPVEVDGVLVPAGDRRDARHHHLEHRVPDAVGSRRSGIASASRRQTPSLRSASRSSSRPPSDDRLPPAKSTVSFLRRTWQVEGKRRIVGHGGCGARLIRDQLVATAICHVNRSLCATAVT